MKAASEQIEIEANELHPQFLSLGEGADARRIAYLLRPAIGEGVTRPDLIWLGGFMSDMRSTKARFLDQWAASQGRGFLRFDYSGHSLSEGRFEAGTIGLWLEEALAVIGLVSHRPQILVGSSMGGWLALLAARSLAQCGEADRLCGLVLIAPAVDFTEKLIFERLSPEARRQIESLGVWPCPLPYSAAPYPITRTLIEEGRKHLMFGNTIRTRCPVHILQGMRDQDVPWQHVMRLVEHLAGDPVVLTLIKDGEHRLSREEDLACLLKAIEAMG